MGLFFTHLGLSNLSQNGQVAEPDPPSTLCYKNLLLLGCIAPFQTTGDIFHLQPALPPFWLVGSFCSGLVAMDAVQLPLVGNSVRHISTSLTSSRFSPASLHFEQKDLPFSSPVTNANLLLFAANFHPQAVVQELVGCFQFAIATLWRGLFPFLPVDLTNRTMLCFFTSGLVSTTSSGSSAGGLSGTSGASPEFSLGFFFFRCSFSSSFVLFNHLAGGFPVSLDH